ncbi:hypothetical protein CROQUDRAFT_98108 [Cronartium quercuum f. sp. fusiforme G11]|uniref:RNA helicase n=1 Tax=Cronartium quercuum f. sp. fusiforme G11 TaxID=708437 RepID=A0A9P6T8Y5_9BASI|nr:hypothetical protein CROQUDRAFT_98108 [Cronartium quercuum f. sp. fusiforme G11]
MTPTITSNDYSSINSIINIKSNINQDQINQIKNIINQKIKSTNIPIDNKHTNKSIDEQPQLNLIDLNQLISQNYMQKNDQSRTNSLPLPNRSLHWLKITLSQFDQSIYQIIISELKSNLSDQIITDNLLNILGLNYIQLIQPIIQIRKLFKNDEIDLKKLNQVKAKNILENQNRPLFSHEGFVEDEIINPHIFSSSNNVNSNHPSGNKFALPIGTTRTSHELFEEILIPAAQKVPMRQNESLIEINSLDFISRQSFHGYSTLNRLQSAVFSVAYNTNENMLICAPTGAGKTDVAMLTILRAIKQYGGINFNNQNKIGKIRKDFKMIYVAPMKALAAEIVRKMGKRLKWLDFIVKELTGDMQLTKSEINDTHLIVTTPEKWDVVTRKASGEEELVSKVKLLIIDEVHLLHEERGSVIETIVARTLRQVESSQSLIRIVGLSATLPNYLDVADFLRVNKFQGLFYFDSSFRPVPLQQHFIGIKGKPNSPTYRKNLDTVTFQKVSKLVQDGHQVMVFVHARKETVKTAEMFREKFLEEGLFDFLDPTTHPQYDSFKREISCSRNKEMKELVRDGLGIHHAGMLRSDRNISERLFETGVTKILCCTATLAWGVNLPAYAVVIKGTQIYDASKGSFVDLGILDVLQIFGRAGRPQYEDHGVGYICTTHDSLDHYVGAITQQHPIESQFIGGLVDSLNAEIALGTVTTIDEGVQWIGWTYLFVRMRKNPMVYGLSIEDLSLDPWLGSKRHSLILDTAKKLNSIGMIKFDVDIGSFISTELGKIASKYYIKFSSIEIFIKLFKPKMSEADVLVMISESVEFEQIKVRESESEEIDKLQNEIPCQIKGGPTTTSGKTNILLQSYISKLHIEDFALISDTNYIAQNSARISRALVEISISKKFAETSRVLIDIGKCIDRRMWPFAHPLTQSGLSDKLLYDLDRRAGEVEIEDLVEMSAQEIGEMCHLNEKLGGVILKAAKQFPRVSITYSIQPISNDLLRIKIELSHEFDWSNTLHGQSEPFWIWIEDENEEEILRINRIYLRSSKPEFEVEMNLPLGREGNLPNSIGIRVISDCWVGADNFTLVDLKGIILPSKPLPFTDLLDLPLISTSQLELKYCLNVLPTQLDPVETQCFHVINHTPNDLLICAPDLEAGRRLAMIGIDRAIRLSGPSSNLIIIISPTKLIGRQFYGRLKRAFGCAPVKIEFICDPSQLEFGNQTKKEGCRVVIITPELSRLVVAVAGGEEVVLTILLDLHLLDESYERIISEIRRWKTSRLIGFSFTLSNTSSLSNCLGIKQIYNFSTHTRVMPYKLNIVTYPITLPKLLIKPVSRIIKDFNNQSFLIFVPSKHHLKTIGRSLVQHLSNENTEMIEGIKFLDRDLTDLVLHGLIILSYDYMNSNEFDLALEMFLSGVIKRMIISQETCDKLLSKDKNKIIKSSKVIIMGTEKKDFKEIIKFGNFIGGKGKEEELEMILMCEEEQKEIYQNLNQNGILIESRINKERYIKDLNLLLNWFIQSGSNGRVDIGRYLSNTFIGQRVIENPWYYDIQIRSTKEDEEIVRQMAISNFVDKSVNELVKRSCLKVINQIDLEVTNFGKLMVENNISIMKVDKFRQSTIPVINKFEMKEDIIIDFNKVKIFFNKLPRWIREQIEEEEEEKIKWCKKVLLIGFLFNRLAFHDFELEEIQAKLVIEVMKDLE